MLRLQKCYPQHWTNISIETQTSRFTINTREGAFGAELYISDNKDLYTKLLQSKDQIEAELGEKPEWMELPARKASRIRVSKEGFFDDQTKWESEFEWLLNEAEKMQRVFSNTLGLSNLLPNMNMKYDN